MIKEGAVFPKELKGRLVDVTPEAFKEHRVYRYGIGFTIPIKTEERDENKN